VRPPSCSASNGDSLRGILGNLDQTFGGQDLYPSLKDKAAHLLYFVIKDPVGVNILFA